MKTARVYLPALLGAALLCCGGPTDQEPVVPVPEGPVNWEVTAAVDKSELQVGEALTVDLTVRHPAESEFLLVTGDELKPFDLIERVDEPSSSPVESRITLKLAAFQLPGEIELPPLQVEYRDDSGGVVSIQTEPVPISLVTSLTSEVTDIHDIKGPVEDIPLPTRWNRLWWLLAVLAVAALAYLVYRKYRRRGIASVAEEPAPPPLLPPEVEAEQALRRLVDARHLEEGRVREFSIALSEIMKRYAGRRFEVPYLERTSFEIMRDLKKVTMADLPQPEKERLRIILEVCDLVKFAKLNPSEENSSTIMPQSFLFIDRTRPRLPAPVDAPAVSGTREVSA